MKIKLIIITNIFTLNNYIHFSLEKLVELPDINRYYTQNNKPILTIEEEIKENKMDTEYDIAQMKKLKKQYITFVTFLLEFSLKI